MSFLHQLSRKVLAVGLIALILVAARVATPEPAKAATPTDGRINLIPWVNSFGAVAVYCVDQFDRPGPTFTGGGIKILSSVGQKLFFAPEKLITPASVKADQIGNRVLILRQGLYSLFALPLGYFWLESAPDAEGKTFIGTWKSCIPVGPGPDAAPPALVCVPIPACTRECFIAAASGDPDCDGNPLNNNTYCNSACGD